MSLIYKVYTAPNKQSMSTSSKVYLVRVRREGLYRRRRVVCFSGKISSLSLSTPKRHFHKIYGTGQGEISTTLTQIICDQISQKSLNFINGPKTRSDISTRNDDIEDCESRTTRIIILWQRKMVVALVSSSLIVHR